jgi:predicted anti-sigma-YlaC factor YlaD
VRCTEASELMSLRLDNLATPDDLAELDAHLAGCAECRLAWSALQEVTHLFESAAWLEPPADFTERVMARVRHRHTPRTIGGAVLLVGASALLSTVALLPVIGLIVVGWQVVNRPPLLTTTIQTLGDLAATGRALLNLALHLTGALVQAVPAPLVVLYMVVAMLLALAWVVAVSQVQARMRMLS